MGKTEGCGGYEAVCHMTGVYPDWWEGYRFPPDAPVPTWLCGTSSKNVRDILQMKMLGPAAAHGTGLLPRALLGDTTKKAGVPDAIDTFNVRHVPTGQWSTGVFKSYDQGREAFEGSEQKFILLDEEDPNSQLMMAIVNECLIRTMTTGGRVVLMFTPKNGLTPVIKYFREKQIYTLNIRWTDNPPHLTEEDKAEILRLTPDYMRGAVSEGIPMQGSGLIFPHPRAKLAFNLFPMPDHWPRIVGLDIGWDHPTAACWCAWDRDQDIWYIYDTYREKHTLNVVNAAAIKARGDWIPVAWPADALQEKGTG
ncbi:MAG: terminase large subunit domain-containing protein, partial [Pyrinomonadaceae bacterium]